MKLYYFETLNPRKACAVAKYLGSAVEFVRIDLAKGENRTPEFLAINPNGKVPALTDAITRLWEADAIMAYLAKADKSDLLPTDERQIDVMRWLSWNAHHFTRHAGSLYFHHIIKPAFGLGEPDRKAVAEATAFFKQFAQVLNDHLSGRIPARRHSDDCRLFGGRDAALCGAGEITARRVRRDRALACPIERAASLARTVSGRNERSSLSQGY